MELVPVTNPALGRALLFASPFNATMRSCVTPTFQVRSGRLGDVSPSPAVTQPSSTGCESLRLAVGSTPTKAEEKLLGSESQCLAQV